MVDIWKMPSWKILEIAPEHSKAFEITNHINLSNPIF